MSIVVSTPVREVADANSHRTPQSSGGRGALSSSASKENRLSASAPRAASAQQNTKRLSASPPPFIPASMMQQQHPNQVSPVRPPHMFNPMMMNNNMNNMNSMQQQHQQQQQQMMMMQMMSMMQQGGGGQMPPHIDVSECLCPTCSYYRAAMILHHHPHLQMQLMQCGFLPGMQQSPGSAASFPMQQPQQTGTTPNGKNTFTPSRATAGGGNSEPRRSPTFPRSMSPALGAGSPSPSVHPPQQQDFAAAAAMQQALAFPGAAAAPMMMPTFTAPSQAGGGASSTSPSAAGSPGGSQNPVMTANDALNQFRAATGHLAATCCTSGGRAMLQSALRAQRPDVVATALAELIADLETVAVDANGCHVLRSLIEVLNGSQADALCDAMTERIVLAVATTSQHTRRILQTLFERHHADSATNLQAIVDKMAANALYLAQTQQGCIALMRVFERCNDAQKHTMVEPLLPKLAQLAVDPFGNYVVQCCLVNSNPVTRAQYVLQGLRGHFAELACNKFSSNVLEKVVRHATAHVRAAIVAELVLDELKLELVAADSFGNFVLQTLVETSVAPEEYEQVSERVRQVLPKTQFARKLEAKLRHAQKIVSSSTARSSVAPASISASP